ncbi:FAD-dependent monooxygenase [Brevundimonas sp. LF-1]|uniref:FAD-dependent oxidoreductase n=1 Tax=Brevundimonas sp. LF-1 TaxID=3126100 RepID=UPI0030E5A680
MSVDDRVLIIGAGPVGSVLALALRQAGVKVALIEKLPRPDHDCRAASCHPPTIAMLERLGLLEAGLDQGLVSPVFHYLDRLSGQLVGRFDLRAMQSPPKHAYVLQWEQWKIAETVLERLQADEGVELLMGHELFSFSQDDQGVTAIIGDPDGRPISLTGRYLVGCDGGRSTVRKLAGIEFEGFTWPERFLKIDTRHDFSTLGSHISNRNYFSAPNDWMNLFMARGEDGEGMWRAVSPVDPDTTDEAATSAEAVEARLQRFCPKPGAYDIVTTAIYRVHQRVAKTFNLGRVLLAGDAAHVNNPVGGMGMNGGIHDAVNLADKLAAIWFDKADAAALLDRYTRQRRKAQIDGVQAQSIANKTLLEEQDPEIRAAKLQDIRRASADPDQHDAFIRKSCMIDSFAAAEAVL